MRARTLDSNKEGSEQHYKLTAINLAAKTAEKEDGFSWYLPESHHAETTAMGSAFRPQ